MYGTIAIMRALPGRRAELAETIRQQFRTIEHVSGFVGHYIYLLDDDPDGLASSAVFDSKASYLANARSEEQNQRYEELRALMREDPQWLDGEVESFLRF
jgi:hypothetical protein